MVALNKAGEEEKSKQTPQAPPNPYKQLRATKTKPTKKPTRKTATNTKIQTKTPNNKEKGLLERHVAVCCALKNIGPFFELDHSISEETASLKETRMKKTYQDINKKEIAGEN
jgi:hypothetical protein